MEREASNVSVLVIDAAVDTRRRVCEQLRETGASVRGCDPLENVVRSVFAEVRPHWVVVDPMVPRTRGYLLLEELRRLDPSCRIVVLTNAVDPEFRERATRCGVDHFLNKASEFDRATSLIARAVWAQ